MVLVRVGVVRYWFATPRNGSFIYAGARTACSIHFTLARSDIKLGCALMIFIFVVRQFCEGQLGGLVVALQPNGEVTIALVLCTLKKEKET